MELRLPNPIRRTESPGAQSPVPTTRARDGECKLRDRFGIVHWQSPRFVGGSATIRGMAILNPKLRKPRATPTPAKTAPVKAKATTPDPAPVETETVARLTTFAPTRREDPAEPWL